MPPITNGSAWPGTHAEGRTDLTMLGVAAAVLHDDRDDRKSEQAAAYQQQHVGTLPDRPILVSDNCECEYQGLGEQSRVRWVDDR